MKKEEFMKQKNKVIGKIITNQMDIKELMKQIYDKEKATEALIIEDKALSILLQMEEK